MGELATCNDYRMDAVWYLLQEMKSSVGNNYRCHNLFEVAKIVVITSHSNAGIDWVHALVNKKPEGSERNRLDIDKNTMMLIAQGILDNLFARSRYNK